METNQQQILIQPTTTVSQLIQIQPTTTVSQLIQIESNTVARPFVLMIEKGYLDL